MSRTLNSRYRRSALRKARENEVAGEGERASRPSVRRPMSVAADGDEGKAKAASDDALASLRLLPTLSDCPAGRPTD